MRNNAFQRAVVNLWKLSQQIRVPLQPCSFLTQIYDQSTHALINQSNQFHSQTATQPIRSGQLGSQLVILFTAKCHGCSNVSL